jgi:MtrB/PioB family decaheme-associated outer membrane protein
VIAGVMAAGAASGQEQQPPWLLEGGATVGGIFNNESGRDQSKIEEYQDLNSGVLSNIWLRGRNDKYWVDGYGENFGRDDMYISLRGGAYDKFKYRVYTNWIPHNFLFNGLTPYQGSGTTLLTPISPFPLPDPSTWNNIGIGYERKDTGGHFEWQFNSPWYARIDGQQLKLDGTKIGSAALGTSPGNGFTDLAFPVSYTTNTAAAEVGYTTRSMQFSANYMYSKFTNDNDSLQWTNPFFGNNLDHTYLALDNRYQRFALNGVVRDLPMTSTLAARYTWSRTTNDQPVPMLALTSSGYGPTLPNVDTFNGELTNQTFSLSLTSAPVKNLDTKLYYNWYKLDNESTPIVFAAASAVSCDGPCTNQLYSYTKNNAGIEAVYRFNRANRLSGGYDYLDVNQTRVDYDDVRYNRLWIEYKNTSLENVTGRIKYQYVERRSNFLLGNAGTGPNDPVYINRFIARFDNSDANQNQVKAVIDWSPLPLLDTSFEAIYRNNDYTGTVLGRTKDNRYELFATISYGPPTLRFTFIGDYEWVKYDSYHRNIGDSALPEAFNPFAAPNSQNYNWAATNKDDNWLLGVAVDWVATEKLTMKGSVYYFRSDGTSDIASQNNFGNPQPISAYDDWKQTSLNLKAVYAFDKNWSFTGGYAYNRYRYSDIAYNGYQYTIPYPGVTTSTSQSYLNGYRAFVNSDANIFYILATYKF